MPILMTIVILFSTIFGGAGITVYAAQDSAPNTPLYGIKLASEDVRLGVTVEQHSRLELQLQFTLRRLEEMAALVKAGQTIPEPLFNRWQNHIQNTFQICSQLSDAELVPALEQVQKKLREQEQIAANIKGEGLGLQVMEQVRAELARRLQLVELGLVDPEQFRLQIRQGQVDPGMEIQENQNPWTTGTPTPGSGYGPGPGTCEGCTPQGPQGTQEKPMNQNGMQNPWTTGTPTPNSSYGPGSGECDTCTPTGPQGPQNGEPQPNQTQEPGSGPGPGSGTGPGGSGPNDPPGTGSGSGGTIPGSDDGGSGGSGGSTKP